MHDNSRTFAPENEQIVKKTGPLPLASLLRLVFSPDSFSQLRARAQQTKVVTGKIMMSLVPKI